MKKRKKIYSVFSFLLAGTLCLSMAACGGTPTPAEDETTSSAPLSGALPVKALQPKHVDENPYMAKSDANIHHDGYNTDSNERAQWEIRDVATQMLALVRKACPTLDRKSVV